VQKIRLERNRLDENLNAVGTGEFEELEVGLVLRSVGYKGLPLPEVPFDSRKGVIPNQAGRVIQDGQVVCGQYAAGWIKRGPSGVIGTNKADAVETVRLLLHDAPSLPLAPEPDPQALTRLLQARGVRVVSFTDWLRLDQLECELGQAQGRPRVKVTSIEKMLNLARG
jgi:ferredoxin--NADP+ reductase